MLCSSTEGDDVESEGFWVVDRVGNDHRFCMIRYLNVWVVDRVKVDITGVFGVP